MAPTVHLSDYRESNNECLHSGYGNCVYCSAV